jgi:hypothetical protein
VKLKTLSETKQQLSSASKRFVMNGKSHLCSTEDSNTKTLEHSSICMHLHVLLKLSSVSL